VTAELGRAPAPFSSYCFTLLRFARENRFRYPYRGWPEAQAATDAAETAAVPAQHAPAGGSPR
jgi:hypothetical protein